MSTAKIKSVAPKPLRRWRLWLAVVALAAFAAVWFFKIKTPAAFSPASTIAFTLEPSGKTYAAYGGSASCRACHAAEFAAWAGSHHARAERLPDATDENAFTPARTFQHSTQQTSLRATNGHYEIIAAGLNGTNEVFRVQRVLAEKPLRQMLVAFPGGRWQATEVA